jgi:2',3'-cyclic-nucleotide 2'-phosphodiesterase/3'-nucleotidase
MNCLPAILLAGLAAQAAAPDTVRLVVVATTDVHGRVYHWDYVRDEEAPWGLTRAATVIDSLRERFPGGVIVVDAGDLIQGNPLASFYAEERVIDPHPVVDALNAVGYDAATPGNHEFNWGVDLFGRAVEAAAFPVVAGNLYRLPRDTVALAPFVVLPRHGVRVGITGFTNPGAMVWDRDNLAGRLRVRPILPEAGRVFRDLADAGADIQIAIIHSGMDGPSSYDTTGVGAENVAAGLAWLPVRPHLVVVGHTHRTMADSVINGVHFIQAPPHARGLAVAHLWLARRTDGMPNTGGDKPPTYEVIRIIGETVSLDTIPPHPVIARRLASAHAVVRSWVSQPLAEVVEGNWSAWYARAQDTPIIDFVNHVQSREAGAQLSATAAFNTRARLGPGEVRLRDVAGLYPYENTLRAVRIDGSALREYLEQAAAYFRTFEPGEPIINERFPGFNFDIVSGVEYVIDLAQPIGARIRALSYQGRLVEPTDTFTLALNNYRQGGGGGFEMLEGLPLVYDGQDIRDLLVEHLRAVGYLRASDYFTPSWSIVPEEAAEAVRAAFGPPPSQHVVAVPRTRGRTDTVIPLDPGRHMPYEAPGRATPPLAEIKLPLEPRGHEHALGRLIADAYRTAARTQVAIVNNVRIARGLPRGPIGREQVEAVLPEPVLLLRATLTGRQLRELLEHALVDGQPTVHVSGLVIIYDPDRRPGDRIREVRLPDGTKIRDGDRYEIAAPTSLGPESGRLAVPRAGGTWLVLENVEHVTTDISETAALVSHLQRLRQPVDAPPMPRFRVER